MGQGCLQMQRSSLAVSKHTDSDCRWQGTAANCWQCMLRHTDFSRKQRTQMPADQHICVPDSGVEGRQQSAHSPYKT